VTEQRVDRSSGSPVIPRGLEPRFGHYSTSIPVLLPRLAECRRRGAAPHPALPAEARRLRAPGASTLAVTAAGACPSWRSTIHCWSAVSRFMTVQ